MRSAGNPALLVYSFHAGIICRCKRHIKDSQMTTIWKQAGNEGSIVHGPAIFSLDFFWAKRMVRGSGEGNLVSLCSAFASSTSYSYELVEWFLSFQPSQIERNKIEMKN